MSRLDADSHGTNEALYLFASDRVLHILTALKQFVKHGKAALRGTQL